MKSMIASTVLGRLLLHLPSNVNSTRRFLVPILNRSDIDFDLKNPASILATLKYNSVVQGKLKSGLSGNNGGDRDVAVKVVPWARPDLAWNEVETFSVLGKHPFLLDFIGVSQDKDDSFLVVTELVPHGLTLEQYCVKQVQAKKAPLDFRLINQLARAMVHVHSKNVVHRDLKASNVFVKRSGDSSHSIRLADFDRSTMLLDGNLLEEPCGSLFHMAPELLRWEKYDRKVDVYAFGVLLYEFAHGGASPYEGSIGSGLPGTMTQEEFATRVAGEDGLRPKWTFQEHTLRRLAERCWHPSPSERPEFEEIVEVLQREYPLREEQLRLLSELESTQRDEDNTHLQLVGTSASIGLVRRRMEDALAVLQMEGDSSTTVCGVFDGLRDSRTADFAARKFGLNMFETVLEEKDKADSGTVRMELLRVDESLARVIPEIECGSTATVALVNSKQLCVGWLGDSSAYLFRKTVTPNATPSVHYQAVSLITKHAPDRPDELERIDSHQGTVGREFTYLDNGDKRPIGPWRAFMPAPKLGETDEKGHSRIGMAVSRALGLFPFRPVISGEPEFVAVDRDYDKDEYLVLASDGL